MSPSDCPSCALRSITASHSILQERARPILPPCAMHWTRRCGWYRLASVDDDRDGQISRTDRSTMNIREYNTFCRKLRATTQLVQWGGSHVWKVGGKVFAIAGDEEGRLRVSFKVSDLAFEILKERRGLRPAPYLASRGLKWIQH